ncbi:MAG: hypothetical protein E7399_09350 [Ruminococcaceae bacterium]|nr:hypothetical protein [Oscillospiraceae bacterium]
MKKALIVYGGWQGHEPDQVSALFEQILTEEGVEVTRSDKLESFLEDLTQYDLLIPIWTMGAGLPEGATQNILEAVESGVGVAGCHGGMCDAFRNDPKWQFMTGSQWVAHPGNSEVTYRVNMVSDSPLVAGIEEFDVKSEQYYIHVDPAVKVHATTTLTDFPGPHQANGKTVLPVVYTKMWGKGKVYYNSLGHVRAIFDIPQVTEMMRRGFLWAMRGE